MNHPHLAPNMPAIETYCLIIATAMLGAVSAMLSSGPPHELATMDYTAVMESVSSTVVIFDDFKLRGWCIAGACGGALVSIFVFTLPSPRELAFKLLASGISGMMFSPMFLRWLGWPVDVDSVLFASGSVSLCAWSVLQVAVPLFTKIFKKEVERRFKGVNGEDIQPKP
jgi:hypothetical protein